MGKNKLTEEIRNQLKKKHGKVFSVVVPVDEDDFDLESEYISEVVFAQTYENKIGDEFDFELPLNKREKAKIKDLKKVDEEKGMAATFVLKVPERKTLRAASKFGKTDPLKSAEIIIENCMVWGDKELLKDDEFFMSIAEQINALTARRTARIKKL